MRYAKKSEYNVKFAENLISSGQSCHMETDYIMKYLNIVGS